MAIRGSATTRSRRAGGTSAEESRPERKNWRGGRRGAAPPSL